MKTCEPKPEEIWAKWRKTWLNDGQTLTKDPYVLKAMQEYAESYHKEKLKEFVCSRCVNITNEMINFLKTGK